MKGIRHSPAQIVEKLRIAEIEQANGLTIGQVCQKLGITEKTYFLWREKYGGMKS